MKRYLISLLIGAVMPGIAAAGGDAGQIMERVYANLAQIRSSNAALTAEITGIDRGNKGKKGEKQHRVVYINNYNGPRVVGTGGKARITEAKEKMYPECVFNMEAFLENYSLAVKEKDSRIKRGIEEIVAVRKGQPAPYPQIRVFVKDGKVESVRFFGINGRKYYEVRVEKYKRIGGVEFPVEMAEAAISANNTIKKRIVYDERD